MTDALEAELAELRTRAANADQLRPAASLTETDIQIGSIVWDATVVDENGVSTRGGMVCDVGITDDGTPYVEVLDESAIRTLVQTREPGVKQWTNRRPAGLRRIMLANIDPASVVPPSAPKMHGWVGKALLGAALSSRLDTFALVVAAGTLAQEARGET